MRYAPVLRALHQHCDIDVIQVISRWAKEMTPGSDEGVIRNFQTIIRPRTRPNLLQRVYMRTRTIAYPKPPHLTFSLDRSYVGVELEHLLEGSHYDCGLWVSLSYADLGAKILRKHCDRVVYDAIDSAFSVAIKTSSRGPLAKWDLYWLRRWEQRICRQFDAASYISKSDISLISRNDTALAREIVHLPNGVLHDDYSSDIATIDGFAPDDLVIAFLGHMAYGPNVRAALRLNRIFQRVRQSVPGARLLIIGRSPANSIKAIADLPGVVVTGTVENIWPYVNRAKVFVFPMETGAGQQNKLLEAMFARRPVVATPIANNGVGATPGQELLIAETDEQICEQIVAVHNDPELALGLGTRGHEFVQQTFSWDAILPRFCNTILGKQFE